MSDPAASAAKEIADWQRRFRAQPHVWVTFDEDGHLGGIYESEEAARLEVAFTERHRKSPLGHRYRTTVSSIPIHSLALAKERFDV